MPDLRPQHQTGQGGSLDTFTGVLPTSIATIPGNTLSLRLGGRSAPAA